MLHPGFPLFFSSVLTLGSQVKPLTDSFWSAPGRGVILWVSGLSFGLFALGSCEFGVSSGGGQGLVGPLPFTMPPALPKFSASPGTPTLTPAGASCFQKGPYPTRSDFTPYSKLPFIHCFVFMQVGK